MPLYIKRIIIYIYGINRIYFIVLLNYSWLNKLENLMRCESKHLCNRMRVYSRTFFLSRCTHGILGFCIAVISGTEHQKTFIQTRDENIQTEFVPFFFAVKFVFSIFEIIKMRSARKVSRYSLWTIDSIYICSSWC